MGNSTAKNSAVFIDRDGTIIRETHYLRKTKDIKLINGAVDAIKLLKNAGFKVVVVTNQSGVGRGYLTEKKLKVINKFFINMLKKKGAIIDALYYCPHVPDDGCKCRKPRLGMVRRAQKRFKINLRKSYTIGDHVNDFLLGKNMKGTGIFILTGHGREEMRKLEKNIVDIRPDKISKNVLAGAKWILRKHQK